MSIQHSEEQTKCPACGQIVDAPVDESLERGEAATSVPDLKKVLHFSQRLYAHALTLQEMIRNDEEETYEALRPKYDRQAAQQFKMFYQALKRSSGLCKRGLAESRLRNQVWKFRRTSKRAN